MEKGKLVLDYAENGWIITWIETGKIYVCERLEGETFATSRLPAVLDQIAKENIKAD